MLIFGENESEKRLMKELHETNPEGTQYPKATNNRGSEGGSYLNPSETGDKALKQGKREAHAGGDFVGNKVQPGEGKQKPMKKGGHRKDCYSAGEEVVPLKHEQPGGGYKKGGRKEDDMDDGERSDMKRGGRR